MKLAAYVCFGLVFALQGQLSSSRAQKAAAGVLTVESFAGGDLGARINAADAALGAAPGTLLVTQPGTVSTPVSLRPGHTLRLAAPVTVSAKLLLASGDRLECDGSATAITSTLPYNGQIVNLRQGADDVVIRGCTVDSNHNYFVGVSDTTITHFQMLNNYGRSTNLFLEVNGSTRPVSTDLLFEGNSVVYAKADPQQGEGGIVISGPVRSVRATGNLFAGGGHGIEEFGADAAAFPSLQSILAANSGEAVYTGNTCDHVTGACVWGSGMHGVVIASNSAKGCGDVCFDAEGSAGVVIQGNYADNCGAGCFAQFFSAYGNSIRGNTAFSTGTPMVLFKNADPGVPQHQQNTAVTGNTLTCVGAVCTAMVMESNYATTLDGNTIVNGSIVGAGQSPLIAIRNNTLDFTQKATAGLAIPDQVEGGLSVISGNIIRSAVAQPAEAPCITSASNGYSSVNTYVIEHNSCSGFGSPDLRLTNNGRNRGVATFWRVDGNYFPHLKTLVDGSNTNTGYSHTNNCGASGCEAAAPQK